MEQCNIAPKFSALTARLKKFIELRAKEFVNDSFYIPWGFGLTDAKFARSVFAVDPRIKSLR
jgi:hypothetical protein